MYCEYFKIFHPVWLKIWDVSDNTGINPIYNRLLLHFMVCVGLDYKNINVILGNPLWRSFSESVTQFMYSVQEVAVHAI
jgi:hypothetical protein